MNKFKKYFHNILFSSKDKPKAHSMYALMEDGPMRKGSIGIYIFKRLMLAYNTKYIDTSEKELILSAMTANYRIETESAWQAFLAEIGEDDD